MTLAGKSWKNRSVSSSDYAIFANIFHTSLCKSFCTRIILICVARHMRSVSKCGLCNFSPAFLPPAPDIKFSKLRRVCDVDEAKQIALCPVRDQANLFISSIIERRGNSQPRSFPECLSSAHQISRSFFHLAVKGGSDHGAKGRQSRHKKRF